MIKKNSTSINLKDPHELKPEPKQAKNAEKTTPTQSPAESLFASSNSNSKKKGPVTRVTIKFDVGFSNALYIRGSGANLSWDKGILLKNLHPDEWLWETDLPFNSCEFKILINDKVYEIGENHPLTCGASIQYSPKF